MNLQNIPSDKSLSSVKHKGRLPNIRKLFRPEPGKYMCDSDLERADAYVVAWDSGAEDLKAMFRSGADIHTENAKALKVSRNQAKQGVHLTNYGGTPRVLALTLGITIHEAERFQRRWFQVHPQIKVWHNEILMQLAGRRYVENRFGYRRYYFGRPDSDLKEALAWIPQSTVACVINRGWVNLEKNLPWVKCKIQVHDSIVYEIPQSHLRDRKEIKKQLEIIVPYEDPLLIPIGFSYSEESWGLVKELEW